ncbi:MAG TPA: glycosyltransferase family 39 protein [Pyrinomonadaceae bacterium]|nr:glycosyltransferase family 39 protein [Pyrinomonadaceae bacterium]
MAAGAVSLYVAARLWRLTAGCLWFDEIFSVHAARHPWPELWRFVAADLIHPPLFYALLKLWVSLGGESLLWLRLFPFLASVAALVPLLLLAREVRLGRGATGLALLLAASNGYLVKYAQELRMYSLLLLLALTSLWLFARFTNPGREGPRRGTLAALTLLNLLLVYTHYYGWLVVACEAVYLCGRAGRRRLLLPFMTGAGVVVVCFLPWVVACLGESGAGGGLAQNVGWITRPGPSSFVELFALLNEPFRFRQSSIDAPYARASLWLGLLLAGLPVILLAGETLRRRGRGGEDRGPRVLFLLLFAALPALLAFAASRVLPHSVWGTRHLIVIAAPFMLLAGAALARLRPRWLKAAALALLGLWLFAAGLGAALRRDEKQVWCTWGELAESALADEPRPARVYAFEDLVAYHLWFALGDEGASVGVVKGLEGIPEDPAYFLPRRFNAVSVQDAKEPFGRSFWVAFRATELNAAVSPLDALRRQGYTVEKVYEQAAGGQRAFLVRVTRPG